MFDICPNCHSEVIFNNPKCPDHRTPRSLLILKGHPSVKTKPVKESKKQARAINRPSLEALLKAAAEAFALEPQELQQKHEGPATQYIVPRYLLCHIAHHMFSYKMREVASFLDLAPGSVSRITQRIDADLETNAQVQKHHKAILHRLSTSQVA